MEECITYWQNRLNKKNKLITLEFPGYSLAYEHTNSKSVISLITPVFNGESFLNDIFGCISKQTISEKVEWIIVDDGSTDHSLEKACALAEENNSRIGTIKIYSLDKNTGGGYALQFAVERTAAKYVAWMSVDDLYVSDDKLEADYEILSKNDVQLVFSNYIWQGSDLDHLAYKISMDEDIKNMITSKGNRASKLAFLLIYMPLNSSSAVYSKEALIKIGNFDTINISCDADTIYKAILSNYNIAFDDRICFYRLHVNQVSKNTWIMLIGTNVMQLRILSLLDELSIEDEFLYWINQFHIKFSSYYYNRLLLSYFLFKKYGDKLNNFPEEIISQCEGNYTTEDFKNMVIFARELRTTKSFSQFLLNLTPELV